jgi:hypothetical protein
MKYSTFFSVSLAMVGLASSSLATDYADLAAKGYRWSIVEGLYACPSKEDARKVASRGGGSTDFQQTDTVRSYYLIPGMVVLVLETDSASGLSRIRAGGITTDLWTATRYLSTRPIRNTLGIIETPDAVSIVSSSPTPAPDVSASPAASPSPN